jgi:uncharacterized membrane protein YdbT with pleckstrin-like domain
MEEIAMERNENGSSSEAPLRVVYRSWKNWWYLLALGWLVVPALAAIWLHKAIRIDVYRDRLFISRGLVENDFEEIFIADIRTMDVRQTMRQRIARTGDLAITTAGRGEQTNVVRGLPRPGELKDFIVKLRQSLTSVEESTD